VVAAVVFIADRVTKDLVTASVPYGTEIPAIDHLVWITNIHNSGAAFGLAPAFAIVFLLASFGVACGLIAYVFTRRDSVPVDIVLGLVLGGTVGNLFDRVMFGTVTDFVDMHFWPVFNVADSAVSTGVVLLLLGYVLRRPKSA
jgi:signal peptidase II